MAQWVPLEHEGEWSYCNKWLVITNQSYIYRIESGARVTFYKSSNLHRDGVATSIGNTAMNNVRHLHPGHRWFPYIIW